MTFSFKCRKRNASSTSKETGIPAETHYEDAEVIILPGIQNGLQSSAKSRSQRSNIYVDTAPVTTEEKPNTIRERSVTPGQQEKETLGNMYAAVDKSKKRKDVNANNTQQEDETIMVENEELYSDRGMTEPDIQGVSGVQDDKSLAGFKPNLVISSTGYDNVQPVADSNDAYSEIQF